MGQHGHFEPLVPLARAAAAAGHDVTVVCRPSMTDAVRETGFEVVAAGPHIPPRGEVAALRPADRAAEERIMRDGFADWQTRGRIPDLLEIARTREVDVMLSDETDFAAPLVSEMLGLPYVPVLVIASGALTRREIVGPPLHRIRDEHGLPHDPDLAVLDGTLAIAPFPRAFRDPRNPLPPNVVLARPAALERPPGDPPAWLAPLGDRPVVWFTLGTVFNMESGDLLARGIGAFDGLPVDAVVTTGRQRDPAALGPLPANVRAEAFVPQGWLLPKADVVVSHGGSGTVIGALAHGAASIAMPMGADQPDNGDRIIELGIGRVLEAATVTRADLADAVRSVVEDAACRQRCRQHADELAGYPSPVEILSMIEGLV